VTVGRRAFLRAAAAGVVLAVARRADPGGRSFALSLVNADGFASFPMFSRDGTRLVFSATRHARAPRDINVFIADWVD
jgi:hypothetical protein